jgi:hypothetical protein
MRKFVPDERGFAPVGAGACLAELGGWAFVAVLVVPGVRAIVPTLAAVAVPE